MTNKGKNEDVPKEEKSPLEEFFMTVIIVTVIFLISGLSAIIIIRGSESIHDTAYKIFHPEKDPYAISIHWSLDNTSDIDKWLEKVPNVVLNDMSRLHSGNKNYKGAHIEAVELSTFNGADRILEHHFEFWLNESGWVDVTVLCTVRYLQIACDDTYEWNTW